MTEAAHGSPVPRRPVQGSDGCDSRRGDDQVSPEVTGVCLPAEHAIELGGLIELLGDWLDLASADVVADALAGFCGGGYTVGELRADLARFPFLLGGDGERSVSGDER